MRSLPCFLLFTLIHLPLTSAEAGDWVPVKISGREGPYAVAQWKRDWPGCEFEDGISAGRLSLLKADGVSWLRVVYAAGKIGPEAGGCGWRWPFTRGQQTEAELRYTVQFEEGFEFVKGGKLPGLCGGPKTITGGNPCTGLDGWSARLMWRKDGRGQAYVYHVNQPGKYGDEFDFPEEFRYPVGAPVGIRLKVSMNTVGKKDGTLQVWASLPGKGERLVVDKTDLEWTRTAKIGVDSILFNTFHGGGDSSWAPQESCAARFGEIGFRSSATRSPK